MTKPRICTKTASYKTHYPQFIEYADRQLGTQFWTSKEMRVDLDRIQLLYEMTEAELHGIKTVLHLFLQYELFVGNEFWGNVVAKTFPRPEVQQMSAVFAMAELGIHAPFYDQLNKQLGLDTDEYYTSYIHNPVLKARMDYLDAVISGKDKILAMMIFTLVEGAILFSSFAFLKSFQSNGRNLIPVIVRGTNQSAIDEELHNEGGSALIVQYYSELGMTIPMDIARHTALLEAVEYIYEHECQIISMIFEKGTIKGIDEESLKSFVRYRLNKCLNNLGLSNFFPVTECKIAEWFEKNTSAYKVIDHFTSGVGMEYESGWNENAFNNCWTD